MSRRRMRTQAEWKVEAQMSLAGWAQHPLQPLLQLPGSLVGEGDGQDGPGGGGLQAAQLPPAVPCLPRRRSAYSSRKAQVILRAPAPAPPALSEPRPYFIRLAMRWMSTVVLPLPAPASSSSGPSVASTALLLLRVQIGRTPGRWPPGGPWKISVPVLDPAYLSVLGSSVSQLTPIVP